MCLHILCTMPVLCMMPSEERCLLGPISHDGEVQGGSQSWTLISLNLIKEFPCTVLIGNSELRREVSNSDGGLDEGWGVGGGGLVGWMIGRARMGVCKATSFCCPVRLDSTIAW